MACTVRSGRQRRRSRVARPGPAARARASGNGERAAGNGHGADRRSRPRRSPLRQSPAAPADRAPLAAPPDVRLAAGSRPPIPNCSAGSPRRWRSSRPTACTGISPRGSTRSERSRSAIRPSTRSGSSRSSRPELQSRIPTSILRIHVDGDSLREALPRLKETYCGPLGYEMEHIGDHEQRVWLRKAIESWRFRTAP